MSIANYLETALLDYVFNTLAATTYVKLHLGDPGEDGTANAAVHTTRAAVTFGAASAGAIANDGAAAFTSMAAAETISHISIWDAATLGNCFWTGALTASKDVNTGDNFTIPVGDLDITLD